jgi:hypothetical protein
MFATVDQRRLLAFEEGADGDRPLDLPAALDDAAERAEALPTQARLRAIARALARDPARDGAPVRVEVVEVDFDGAMRPHTRRLGVVRVRPGDGQR